MPRISFFQLVTLGILVGIFASLVGTWIFILDLRLGNPISHLLGQRGHFTSSSDIWTAFPIIWFFSDWDFARLNGNWRCCNLSISLRHSPPPAAQRITNDILCRVPGDDTIRMDGRAEWCRRQIVRSVMVLPRQLCTRVHISARVLEIFSVVCGSR